MLSWLFLWIYPTGAKKIHQVSCQVKIWSKNIMLVQVIPSPPPSRDTIPLREQNSLHSSESCMKNWLSFYLLLFMSGTQSLRQNWVICLQTRCYARVAVGGPNFTRKITIWKTIYTPWWLRWNAVANNYFQDKSQMLPLHNKVMV